MTSQFASQSAVTLNVTNQELYEQQPYVQFPNQVVVYSVDSVSSQFNGSKRVFDLTRGGLVVPPSQLSAESLIVSLGAVVQTPGINYTLEGSSIVFIEAPATGTVCDIRVITSEDNESTLIMVPLTFVEPFDGSTGSFTAVSTTNISTLYITLGNTFMFLGGVEQIPGSGSSYTLNRISPTEVQFTFLGEVPPAGTTLDLRAVCSGTYWTVRTLQPVAVYSLDTIAPTFDGAVQQFALTAGGLPLNPNVVNAENLFVSVGGALQLPNISYTVDGSTITFTEAPLEGTTSNLRIVTNAEFITCPQPGYGQEIQQWGLPLTQEVLGQALNQINDFIPPG